MQFVPDPRLCGDSSAVVATKRALRVLFRFGFWLGRTVGVALAFAALASAASAQSLQWTQRSRQGPGLQWSTVQAAPGQEQQSGWRTVTPSPELRNTTVAEEEAPPKPVVAATPRVMAMSRGITVNRILYPDVAITVPNGFKRDPQRFLSLSVDATNQIRSSAFTGCRGQSSCPDAEFNAELALLQAGPMSLELLYTVANAFPDSNSSTTFTGQQLGFRLAANLSPTVGVAIGGESQLNLDNNYAPVVSNGAQQLKGRTLYAVASAAIPLSSAPTPPVLTITAGAGNGYYGLSSSGVSDDQWGPIGSISYAFNDRVSLGVEYSGYALSAGLSVRPFKEIPLTGSLYVTDFVGGVPDSIDSFCSGGSCSTRFLGRITYSL